MRTCGIIAEFNPLHKGHEYLISEAKSVTNSDYAVVVMSGDYVQRGCPAIINKYVRTTLALNAGADAVIELPALFSTGSAQYFSRGAVGILDGIGVINSLVFGSESGDIDYLRNLSYEKNVVDSPNNILGREYISALKYLKSSIEPVTIKRLGSDYNEKDTVVDGFASASYIRDHFSYKELEETIPAHLLPILKDYLNDNSIVTQADYSDMLIHKLLGSANDGFDSYFDIYPDLSMKIIDKMNHFTSFEDFITLLKSKDITYSHISRALIHIILGIKKEHIDIALSRSYKTYARLLGFKTASSKLISSISANTSIPFITKLSDSSNLLDDELQSIINIDIMGSHLHSYITNCKKNRPYINEYTRPIIKI